MAGHPDLAWLHRRLIDDTVRTRAFIQAIESVVQPGDVVVDLGSGTGILALAAARAGARRVVAVERSEVASVIREVARANDLHDVVEVQACGIDAADPGEPVDVVVSECLGLMGVGGQMLDRVHQFVARHLRPGGAVIPWAITPVLAGVDSPTCHATTHAFSARPHGFDLSPCTRLTSNNAWVVHLAEAELCTGPLRLPTVHLRQPVPAILPFEGPIQPTRAATLTGWAGWFEAQLTADVRLDTSPSAPDTIWGQLYLPLAAPVAVHPGHPIQLDFASSSPTAPGGGFFRWDTRVGGMLQRHSTLRAHPSRLDPRAV